MSFATEIKNEICALKFTKLENIAFLSGFMRSNDFEIDDEINIIVENPKIVRKIYITFKELYDINILITSQKGNNFSKKNYYKLTINQKVEYILKDLNIYDEKVLDRPYDYFLEDEDIVRAYLRGAFLASGSINDPKKSRYHLEFLIDKKEEAELLVDLLKRFNITSKVLRRDKGYMTYVKEAEKIGDFLRIISANNAVLYYEDIRIYRDHKNMTNRLNNMEQANTDKIIEASNNQLNDIEIIKEKLGYDLVDEKIKEVMIYREKYKEASLLELTNIINYETNQNLTKSGLNHRIRKIHELAEKLREQQKK